MKLLVLDWCWRLCVQFLENVYEISDFIVCHFKTVSRHGNEVICDIGNDFGLVVGSFFKCSAVS